MITPVGRVESGRRRDVPRPKCTDYIAKRFQTVHDLQKQINSRLGDQNSDHYAHTSENV